jgi:hypothetical protein
MSCGGKAQVLALLEELVEAAPLFLAVFPFPQQTAAQLSTNGCLIPQPAVAELSTIDQTDGSQITQPAAAQLTTKGKTDKSSILQQVAAELQGNKSIQLRSFKLRNCLQQVKQ